MSEVAEEAMDSSAVSEEEVEDQQETSQENQSSPSKNRSKISGAGEIIEGKRTKKTVERLDFQAPKLKEKLKIGDGSGDKLGDIPRTSHQITKMKAADLKPLHAILFDRPGKAATIKKNLRLFNGFPFEANSEQYTKKREKLAKNSNFTNSKLKVVCGVLDLEKKGTHTDLVDRILTFLIAPKNSGKRLPVKKKRKSKKNISGDDSSAKTKKKKKSKPRPKSASSSPKKSKTGSKSKAIVMDSSSDEDDDEEDEKAGASAEVEGSDTEDKPSEKEDDESDKSEESEEEEEEDDDDESPKSKSGRAKMTKKSAPAKRKRTPAKKTGPPKKRSKKDTSEESESDADSEVEKPQKTKSTKPTAKTKKADSSSNSRANTNTVEDSSDDDEPLIKMVKKAPTDEQLRETVKSLLKEANLEEMTMKQICQRVFDTYPDDDLTSKKDYIKQTVKSLIT